MYKWQKVKALRASGESIKGIARKVGISKNTVRKYLRSSNPPEFKCREYDNLLENYEAEIIELQRNKYIGTRIYAELVKKGYCGSLSTVHRFIADNKKEEEKNQKATTRVETAPGKQMQYDWKVWELMVNEKPVKIYIHELILSYSRKKYWTCSISITSADIIRAISLGIEYFKGVAHELIIDNPKQMVITHRRDGVIRFNDEFLMFCGLYGIEPIACMNYRARTKGKVERPFYYLQEHLLRGIKVTGIFEFDIKLNEFMTHYNNRLHSSLKESPDQRFSEEAVHLKNIPVIDPAHLFCKEMRKVTNDGYVMFNGGFYPVPMKYCLSEVWIENLLGKILKVYDKEGKIILDAQINPFDQGLRPVHPEHQAINDACMEKRNLRRSVLIERFISLFGTSGEEYAAGLKINTGVNIYWHISEIMDYCEVYHSEAVLTAIKECIAIGSYHKNSVLRLISPQGLKTLPLPIISSYPSLPQGEVNRPLSVYAQIEEVCHE